jgi:excisionase family DNA binding protein
MSKDLSPTRRGFSVEDVAHAYGLSRQRVYDEINAGRLHSLKVGRRRIITMEHLRAWEQECAA